MVQPPPPPVAASNAESTEMISLDDAIRQLYKLVHKISIPKTRTAKVAVTSSSGYSNSSEVKLECWECAEVSWNWLQLVCCAYLQ